MLLGCARAFLVQQKITKFIVTQAAGEVMEKDVLLGTILDTLQGGVDYIVPQQVVLEASSKENLPTTEVRGIYI